MSKTSASVGGHQESEHIDHDNAYHAFLAEIKANFQIAVDGSTSLFTAGARKKLGLFDLFLDNLPDQQTERQLHDCQACRAFFSRYGNLVTINPASGEVRSSLWSNYTGPDFYSKSIRAIQRRVEEQDVSGVFVENEAMLGTPETSVDGYQSYGGRWPAGKTFQHLAVALPSKLRYKAPVLTKGQRAAELREDFRNLDIAVRVMKYQSVNDALTLLKSGSLPQGQQFVAATEWLRDRLDENQTDKRAARNLRWLAVAAAPAGFAKPAGRPYGKVIKMLEEGKSLDHIKGLFAEIMDPLKHKRPQKLASNSNLQQAEKVVQALNAAPAFARRYARLEEIPTRGLLWAPQPVAGQQPASSDGSVFGHLRKGVQQAPLRTETFGKVQDITFEKFVHAVLPSAESIQMKLAPKSVLGTLLTAVDADAPPIFMWDNEDERNPFSFYTYPAPRPLSDWSLDAKNWQSVQAITTLPSQWNAAVLPAGQQTGAIFVLAGAKDKSTDAGLGLFPSFLKSDFMPVRRAIEEFSNKGKLEGHDEASAAGFLIMSDAGSVMDNVVRVISDRGRNVADYKIDRID